jgi:hypothetical protein
MTIPTVLSIAVAAGFAIGGGLPLVAPHRRPAAGDFAAAATVALGNASVLALAAGLAGLRLPASVFLLLLVAPGIAATMLRHQHRPPRQQASVGRR